MIVLGVGAEISSSQVILLISVLAEIRIVLADMAARPVARHSETRNLDQAIIKRGLGIELGLPQKVEQFLLARPFGVGRLNLLAHLFVDAL